MNIASKIRLSLVKITVALILASVVFTQTLSPALAQTARFDTTFGQWQDSLNGKTYNKETFDFQSLIGVFSGLVTMGVGCLSPQCPKELKTGVVSKLNDSILGLYSAPPASGVYYAQDMIQHMNPVQPAYAQQAGVGFSVMQPFLNMWRAVRNVTYLLFVLGIVALGFMVMFRRRISPQAVMTVQAAMPRIIIALIFITFSYAIVGFVIDLMYVLFGLLVWGLDPTGNGIYSGHDSAATLFNNFVSADIGRANGFIFGHGVQGALDIIGSNNTATSYAMAAGLAGIGFAVLSIVFSGGIGAIALSATLIPFLLGLVFAFIFFLFKVLLTVARAYLNLIIFTIFAPIIILFSALSGKGIWDGWLKNVVANVLVFLVIGVIIMLTEVLRWQIDAAGTNVWGPPYVGNGQGGLLNGIIALGAIMAIPSVPDIINQFMNIRPVNVQLPSGERIFNQASSSIDNLVRRRYSNP
jgi:hypothetical protein